MRHMRLGTRSNTILAEPTHIALCPVVTPHTIMGSFVDTTVRGFYLVRNCRPVVKCRQRAIQDPALTVASAGFPLSTTPTTGQAGTG